VKRTLFIVIIFPVVVIAEGPLFRHGNSPVQQEFENVYQDIRAIKPNISAKNITNVKDYGAKGDGVTDDTAAFMSAILHATTTINVETFGYGAVVYAPDGVYKIGLNLLDTDVSFIGNPGGTIFRQISTTTFMINYNGNPVSSNRRFIKDIYFYGAA